MSSDGREKRIATNVKQWLPLLQWLVAFATWIISIVVYFILAHHICTSHDICMFDGSSAAASTPGAQVPVLLDAVMLDNSDPLATQIAFLLSNCSAVPSFAIPETECTGNAPAGSTTAIDCATCYGWCSGIAWLLLWLIVYGVLGQLFALYKLLKAEKLKDPPKKVTLFLWTAYAVLTLFPRAATTVTDGWLTTCGALIVVPPTTLQMGAIGGPLIALIVAVVVACIAQCFCKRQDWSMKTFGAVFVLFILVSTACCFALLIRAIIDRGFVHVVIPSALKHSELPDLANLAQQIAVFFGLLLCTLEATLAIAIHTPSGRTQESFKGYFELAGH